MINCKARSSALWLPTALIFVLTFHLHGQQIEVTNEEPYTPENLITDVFLGSGVDILDVIYEGPPESVGFFKNGNAGPGLDRGLVMTTGVTVTNGTNYGVNAPGWSNASVDNGSTVVDPDLASIIGNSDIHNAVRYTITFRPIYDSLSFRYIFASEEYPEYVCGDFNDVFGFFISGPGINGPYTNGAENIALIPGTDRPVTINTINSGFVGTANTTHPDNCSGSNGSLDFFELYNDHDGSDDFPVFDGWTDIFTANLMVVPCEIYTIKLVIADVGDRRLDSGVFLEAKSFDSQPLEAEITAISIDDAIAEGCEPATVSFTISEPQEQEFILDYIIGGTAQPGTDYVTFPTDLVIPAGETQVVVPIEAIDDGLTEERETITFDVRLNGCTRKTYTIYIDDARLLPPSDLGTDISACWDESVQLFGKSPTETQGPLVFTNSDSVETPGFPSWSGGRFSDIEVSGIFPEKLMPGMIRSVCIDSFEHRWLEDMDIYLVGPDGQTLELTSDNGGDGGNGSDYDYYINTCFTPTATQRIDELNPALGFPFTGNFLPEGDWADFWEGDKNSNGTYQLYLRDDSFGNSGTLFSWSITFEPIYGITYEWSPAEGLSCIDCPEPMVQPEKNTEYGLRIMDTYGCAIDTTVSVVIGGSDELPSPICRNLTQESITIAWDPLAGFQSYEIKVDNGDWIALDTTLEYTATNLDFEQTVDFQLRGAHPNCPGQVASISCTTLPCLMPTANISITDAGCSDTSDGAISIEIESGTAPFSFELGELSNSTGSFTDLAAGEYALRVYDANNCPATYDLTVGIIDDIQVQLQIDQVAGCDPAAIGQVSATVSGSSGAPTYTWSDGQETPTAGGLSAGTYQLTVTSSTGCLQLAEITLAPPVDSLITVDVFNDQKGAVDLSVSGGTPPYTYRWSNGMTTEDVIGLPPGIYSVEVTDTLGCSAFVQVIVPEQLRTDIDPGPKGEVIIVPNPNLGDFDITVDIPMGGSGQLYLYDATGKQVFSRLLPDLAEQTFPVSLDNWAEGLYYLQLVTQEGQFIRKVVIFSR